MERLKQILKEKGKTMTDLADCIGIKRESLYSRIKDPKFSTITQIAECLNIDPIELMVPSKKYAHFYSENEWYGIRKK